MHLYFFLRGKFEQIELWKCHAQTAYWKWRRINLKTGKEEIKYVQGALRPTIFGAYEYIFPKESLVEVLSFFGMGPDTNDVKFQFCWIGAKARYAILRKMFNCKKIPNSVFKKAKETPSCFSVDGKERGVGNCIVGGAGPHIIGIKEDTMIDLYGYHQEGL